MNFNKSWSIDFDLFILSLQSLQYALTDADLQQIGMLGFGSRRRLIQAIGEEQLRVARRNRSRYLWNVTGLFDI
jgi:hypothetical protein